MTRKTIVAVSSLFALAGAALGQTPDQARSYNAELLADASTRINSAAADPVAPKVGGAVQFRFDYNYRDSLPGGNDATTGFQSRLNTIWLTGTVEKLSYRVQGNFDQAAGQFTLEDAYFVYPLEAKGWAVGAGQLSFPVLWEDYTNSWQQLDLDYSPTDSVFSPGRVQGAFFNYTGDQFRFWGALDDGAGTANTDFTSAAEADYALTVRGEYKFAGDWARFDEMTSFRNSDLAGKVALAAHWQSGGNTVNTADMDIGLITADVCIEGNGWNGFGAVIYRTIEPAAGETLDDWGVVLQGGIFVSTDWELFARYDASSPDDDARPGTQSTFSAFTLGTNHYIIPDSLAARLSFDVMYLPDKQSESIVPASTLTGVLADTEGGQWNFRVQMQLLF